MKGYLVIYEQADDGGWSAYSPDLPVFAAADSRDEIESSWREALALFKEELASRGESLPPPATEAAIIPA